MPGSDLVAGNVFSTALTVTGGSSFQGAAAFSTTLTAGSTSAVVGAAAAQSITGIYRIQFSSAAVSGAGASSGSVTIFPSTAFTFSTNDILLSVSYPSSSTSFTSNSVNGLGIGGAWPTSSGGLAVSMINASTVSLSPLSTTFTVTILRTT